MTFENVSLYAGGNEGFTEAFGDGGNVYRNVRIRRRPNSTGLLSINADGFNVDSVGRGPTIMDSEVGFNGDDFLSVHNRLQVVCNISTSNELVVMDLGQGHFEWDKYGSVLPALRPADVVTFHHLGSRTTGGSLLGAGTVHSSRNVSTEPGAVSACMATRAAMAAPPYNSAVVEPFEGATLYQLQVVDDLPAKVRAASIALVTVPRRSSPNAVIRGNHFHDGAQRMGIIGASGAVVEGNVFARTLNGGLHVESEQWALEGDEGLANITISNNIIVSGTSKSNFKPIDVMSGSTNVVCRNNVWQRNGKNVSLGDAC
jgi:hypothetical protein